MTAKNSTIIAAFVEESWDVVTTVSPRNAAYLVAKLLTDGFAADEAKKRRMVVRWWSCNAATINGWVAEVHHDRMTEEEFFDNLRENLLAQ